MAKRSSFATLPMAAAGVGLVVAVLLSILLVKSSVDSEHRDIMGDTIATNFAQQVDIKEADIRSQLSRLAGSKIVADAMTGTLTDLARAETTLTDIIPEAVKVKLIPQGQARTDQSFPPFNYTALDLVNRVEAGQNTHAEVISTHGAASSSSS